VTFKVFYYSYALINKKVDNSKNIYSFGMPNIPQIQIKLKNPPKNVFPNPQTKNDNQLLQNSLLCQNSLLEK